MAHKINNPDGIQLNDAVTIESNGTLKYLPPTGLPGPGYVMTSDASGNVVWGVSGGIGSITGTGVNNQIATWAGTSSLDGSSSFTFDGTNIDITSSTPIRIGNTNNFVIQDVAGNASVATTSGNLAVSSNFADLQLSSGAGQVTISSFNGVLVEGAYTLPNNVGTPNYVMSTNGAGTATWVDVDTLTNGGSGLSGSGSANRVAYWSSGTNLSNDAGFEYDPTINTLYTDNLAVNYQGSTLFAGFTIEETTTNDAFMQFRTASTGLTSTDGLQIKLAESSQSAEFTIGTGTGQNYTFYLGTDTSASQFAIQDNSLGNDLFAIKGDGTMSASEYGGGGITGAAAYLLGVDASGNVIEESLAGGGGTPGGSNFHVQYNNNGSFGGDTRLQWDPTNDRLLIGNSPNIGQATLKVKPNNSDNIFIAEAQDDDPALVVDDTGRTWVGEGHSLSASHFTPKADQFTRALTADISVNRGDSYRGEWHASTTSTGSTPATLEAWNFAGENGASVAITATLLATSDPTGTPYVKHWDAKCTLYVTGNVPVLVGAPSYIVVSETGNMSSAGFDIATSGGSLNFDIAGITAVNLAWKLIVDYTVIKY